MAFPKADRQYALITDVAMGMANTPGSLRVMLTQVDKEGNHEKNYSPFLQEAAAGVWGMDFFNDYLKGKYFILYADHKPLEKLGHLHSKTLNKLQMALLEHDLVIQYKKGSNMPADYLSRLPGRRILSPAFPLSTLSKQISTTSRGRTAHSRCSRPSVQKMNDLH
jgi:hypothetical protein